MKEEKKLMNDKQLKLTKIVLAIDGLILLILINLTQ